MDSSMRALTLSLVISKVDVPGRLVIHIDILQTICSRGLDLELDLTAPLGKVHQARRLVNGVADGQESMIPEDQQFTFEP